MNKLKTSEPAGILNADYFKKNVTLCTFYLKEHLKDYMEHYWLISWKLPEDISHTQDVIPHPNTHLTFLKNNSHIQGICKQKYTHTLEGNGRIGRLLIPLFLFTTGRLSSPMFYLLGYLESNRKKYYERLAGISAHG